MNPERELSSALAEVANWRRRSIAAETRVKELDLRLASVTAAAVTWEQKATFAEAKVNELTKRQPAQSSPDDRFRRLRSLLAKELHSDHTKIDGIERVIRAELFKALWPRIEQI